MCDPITLMVASTAISAAGAYGNSQSSKAAYGMQAQVARNNAKIAEWQAEDALARGDQSVYRQRLQTKQLKGTQRARLAASGVDLGVGSALEILTDTDYFGELDANTIKDNAAKEAWALRNQAQNFQSDAALMQYRSDSEKPWLAAGTSLLSGATKVAGSWYGSK